ncbi:DUF3885 domain-containing protein [Streptomyces violaceorubidus]
MVALRSGTTPPAGLGGEAASTSRSETSPTTRWRAFSSPAPGCDGGADVFLTTSQERDRVRARHTDWLSRHPSGL